MTSFVAIYRGQTVGEAKLIAVSADPVLVAEVSAKLLKNPVASADDAINKLERGRKSALKSILQEARNDRDA